MSINLTLDKTDWKSRILDNRSSSYSEVNVEWECAACTYKNSGLRVVCELCKTSRSVLSLKKSDKVKKGISCYGETISIDKLRAIEENDAIYQWKKIIKRTKVFLDKSFPAVPKSLYYNPEKKKQEICKWIRPHQIKASDVDDPNISWVIFRSPLKPSDITQG